MELKNSLRQWAVSRSCDVIVVDAGDSYFARHDRLSP